MAASTIKLPPGFELEQPAMNLPPGFELESAPPQIDLPGGTNLLNKSIRGNPRALELAKPTQFEEARNPDNRQSFAAEIGKALSEKAKGAFSSQDSITGIAPVDMAIHSAIDALIGDKERQTVGRSVPYRAVAAVGSLSGVANPRASEAAAEVGNANRVAATGIADAAPVLAAAAAPSVVRGVSKTGGAVLDAIPQAARAGEAFQQVMSKVKNVPIDVTGPGDAALRINKMAESGGTMPKVVRDFLKRVTNPNKPALTYSEAREFYSNASKLSVDETNRLTPRLKREVGNFREALNASIEDVANDAGELSTYRSAMKEYSSAMKIDKYRRNAKAWAIKGAIRFGQGAAIGAGAKAMYDLVE